MQKRVNDAIESIQDILKDVLPRTMAEWECRLACCKNHAREVRLWKGIAKEYLQETEGNRVGLAKKKSAFASVMIRVLNQRKRQDVEDVFQQLRPSQPRKKKLPPNDRQAGEEAGRCWA